MSLYFFHLRDHVDLLLDDEGREFAALDEIAASALADARGIMAEEVRGGRIRLDQRIDVEDSAGALVHRLEFQDAVEIVGGPSVG